MHQPYRDMFEGGFAPQIEITRRADNGHYVASALGRSKTHHSQDEAVAQLQAELEDALLKGDITPEG